MDIAEVVERVYHVTFPSRKELAYTFLRFQEHYESPHFRGKIFSLDEYKKWYLANHPHAKRTGRFTYHEDWGGFNIPSYVMRPFYEGRFDPLSGMEKALLDAFEPRRKGRFYVIGTRQGSDPSYLVHEIAHGLFSTDASYKNEALRVLDLLSAQDTQKMIRWLEKTGYTPSVFKDEMQAFLCADPNIVKHNMDVRSTAARKAHARLKASFRQRIQKKG